MRRARSLTPGERWELFFMLALLVLGCVGLSAFAHLDSLPRIFSSQFQSPAPQSPASPNPSPHPLTPELRTQNSELRTQPTPTYSVSADPTEDLLPNAGDPDATDAGKSNPAKKPPDDIRYYHGQKYRYAKTLRLRVTAYAPDSRCCWPFPGTTTASGQSVKTNRGKLVAADTRLIPLHALVAVPGYNNGAPVPVLDRGGAIKGYRLDVLLPQFDQAKDWGTKTLNVKIYTPVD